MFFWSWTTLRALHQNHLRKKLGRNLLSGVAAGAAAEAASTGAEHTGYRSQPVVFSSWKLVLVGLYQRPWASRQWDKLFQVSLLPNNTTCFLFGMFHKAKLPTVRNSGFCVPLGCPGWPWATQLLLDGQDTTTDLQSYEDEQQLKLKMQLGACILQQGHPVSLPWWQSTQHRSIILYSYSKQSTGVNWLQTQVHSHLRAEIFQ